MTDRLREIEEECQKYLRTSLCINGQGALETVALLREMPYLLERLREAERVVRDMGDTGWWMDGSGCRACRETDPKSHRGWCPHARALAYINKYGEPA